MKDIIIRVIGREGGGRGGGGGGGGGGEGKYLSKEKKRINSW